MNRTSLRAIAALGVAAVAIGTALWLDAPRATAQSRPASAGPVGEWRTYGADLANTRYSPLDQINAENFGKLEVAWRFKTDSLGPFPEYKLEGTPLMVKGVLYTTGGTRRSVVALDAKTGELMWAYSLREGKRAAVAPRQLSGRGVASFGPGCGSLRWRRMGLSMESHRHATLSRGKLAASIWSSGE